MSLDFYVQIDAYNSSFFSISCDSVVGYLHLSQQKTSINVLTIPCAYHWIVLRYNITGYCYRVCVLCITSKLLSKVLDDRIFCFISVTTKHRGWVVGTPYSYSWRLWFKSRSEYRVSWLRCFVIFSVPSGKCWDITLNQSTTTFFHIRSD